MPGSFDLFDHTADAGVAARGRTAADAFVAAARGLVSLLFGEEERVEELPAHGLQFPIRLRAPDMEGLLVAWLNEILYLVDSELVRPALFEIDALGPDQLRGMVYAAPLAEGHHPVREVKAATYHGLTIRRDENGWEVRVIFDL